MLRSPYRARGGRPKGGAAGLEPARGLSAQPGPVGHFDLSGLIPSPALLVRFYLKRSRQRVVVGDGGGRNEVLCPLSWGVRSGTASRDENRSQSRANRCCNDKLNIACGNKANIVMGAAKF